MISKEIRGSNIMIQSDGKPKTIFIWLGMIFGSWGGSAIAINFFDVNYLSVASLIAGTVGGLIGIGVGYKFTNWIDDWF